MMKVLIDPQTFNEQKFGGISRYYTELYHLLRQNDQIDADIPLLYTDNIHFKESPLFQESYQNKYSILIRYSRILRPFLPRKLKKKNTANLLELLEKGDFDVFIPSYYDPYFLPLIKDKPFVVTVHDMIYELFPKYFPADDPTAANKKLIMEKATRIIAISENTKADILKIYPHIPESKIDIVHMAYSISDTSESPKNLPDRYLLFVGNRSVYKNFGFALRAVAPILKNNPDLFFVCAGGNPFNPKELTMIAQLGLSRQLIQQNFHDNELSAYYSRSQCFIFPSEYEGFGIPVLEAMASKCPVILPYHSSFPEVAGDAGFYFELNNEEDLRKKVEYVLTDTAARSVYIARGLKQAGKFSWEKTAAETVEVLAAAIKKPCQNDQPCGQ
jgi:glycosyltransferase involved in cell wall biosynthesis